jgi:hypothetical protein
VASHCTVYNLTVEGHPEYYANGILVHNCSYCEARHGIVWKRDQAPRPPAHPNCRCVLLPWREDSLARGDEYYLTTRRAMADRREDEGRAGSTATAAAPFDRANGTSVPPPAWAPGRGWLR